MQKYFIVIFITLIICGSLWFVLGRNGTKGLEYNINELDRSIEEVERSTSSFGVELNNYTEGVSLGIAEAVGINGELSGLQTRFWDSTEQFSDEIGTIHTATVSIADGVDTVELGLRESLIVSRDIADIAYEARRRAEKDEEAQ